MSAGRHAVVTGAGSGIGAAIAGRLAGDGYALTLLGRRSDALEATAAAAAGAAAVECRSCDVADGEAVAAALDAAAASQGTVAVLVNAAGIAPTAPFHRLEATAFRQVLDTNLMGVFHCCRRVVPAMREQGYGRIINIASTAALKGYAYVSAYCASKHGVLGLTRALALELAGHGVTVNAVCPGYTDTAIIRDAVANIVAKTGRSEDEALAGFTATNPQGRLIEPEEVAAAVQWLCADEARSVTGQALSISGGEV